MRAFESDEVTTSRVVVITGTERAFSAGADLSELPIVDISRWMPRVNGNSPGYPSDSGRSWLRAATSYRGSTSIPESVNRRGSSGPTTGAIDSCSVPSMIG